MYANASGSYPVAVSLYGSPTAKLYPYQATAFGIVVNNTGGRAINNLVIGLYINNVELRHYVVDIPARSSASLTANYTYTAPGTYVFKAEADPAGVFNITDRQAAQSTLPAIVLAPQSASGVYGSLPGGNVASTQSFTLDTDGVYALSAVGDRYDISAIAPIFDGDSAILVKVYENLYGYIAYANGAYTSYSNGTSGYAAWLQGTVNPGLVNYVLSTFYLRQARLERGSLRLNMTVIDNTTSLCTYYEEGWTKMIVWHNGTADRGQTCASVSAANHSSNESAVLVSALKGNKELVHYQSGFEYLNSTLLGSSVSYSDGATAVMNFSKASGFFFMGSIRKITNSTFAAYAANSPLVCRGLIHNSGNVSICSRYLLPKSGKPSAVFSMINTTAIFPGFVTDFYSLVNASQLVPAHQNAVHLTEALGIANSTLRWTTGYRNSCFFKSNSSFPCRLNSFGYTNNTANITLGNSLGSPIRINSIACYFPGSYYGTSVNATLDAGANSSYTVHCARTNLPAVGAVTSYLLQMNYTHGNSTSIAVGALNVTSYGFS